MSFLKKLGQIAQVAAKVVPVYGPVIGAFIPEKPQSSVARVSDTIGTVAGIVMQVEAMGASAGATGEQKLKMAAVAVAQIYLQSSALAGKKIANPALFQAGVEKSVAGAVDILNSVHEDEATP